MIEQTLLQTTLAGVLAASPVFQVRRRHSYCLAAFLWTEGWRLRRPGCYRLCLGHNTAQHQQLRVRCALLACVPESQALAKRVHRRWGSVLDNEPWEDAEMLRYA